MKTYVRAVFTVALAGLLLVTLAGSALAQGVGQPPSHFRAPLSGAEEVPPVETLARGVATFKFDRDLTELSYKLIVANIEDVMVAHIHFGPAGENGPAGVFLFANGPVTVNGVLAEGTITADDLIGGVWADLAELESDMRAGLTYVNVHTLENPPGEIRGQIR